MFHQHGFGFWRQIDTQIFLLYLTIPTIIINEKEQSELIYKRVNTIPIGFRLSKDDGQPLKDQFKNYHPTMLVVFSKKANNFAQEYSYVKMEPCTREKHIHPEYWEAFKDIDDEMLSTYICPTWDKDYDFLNFYGGTIDFTFYAIMIYDCGFFQAHKETIKYDYDNDNYDITCNPRNVIDAALSIGFVDYFIGDYSISSYDTNPVSPKILGGRTEMGNGNYRRIWL